jgi:hypothetical protein
MLTPAVLYQPQMSHASAFRVMERDVAILEALYRYRMLTRRLVEQLFFSRTSDEGTPTRAYKRLRSLFLHGFVECIERPFAPLVFRLAARGAKLLAERNGVSPADFYYWGRGDDQDRHPTQASLLFLEHGIALAQVRIAMEQAIQAHDYLIETWQDDVDLRRAKAWDTVSVDRASGKKEPIKIRPDGYVALQTPRGRGHFFIEMDRSTESIKTAWQRKILGYKVYALSSQFQRRYAVVQPNTAFRVLTVTLTPMRAEHLKAAAERYGPQEATSRFLFAPLDALMTRDPLNDPIWLRSGVQGQHTVL